MARVSLRGVIDSYLQDMAGQALAQEFQARVPLRHFGYGSDYALLNRGVRDPDGINRELYNWTRDSGPGGSRNPPPGWVDPDAQFWATAGPLIKQARQAVSAPYTPEEGGKGLPDPNDFKDDLNKRIADNLVNRLKPKSVLGSDADFNKGFLRKEPDDESQTFTTLQDLLSEGDTGLRSLVEDYLASYGDPQSFSKGFQGVSPPGGDPASAAPLPFEPADKGTPAPVPEPTGAMSGMQVASYYDPVFNSYGGGYPSGYSTLGQLNENAVPYVSPADSKWGVVGGGGGYRFGELGPASTQLGLGGSGGGGSGGASLDSVSQVPLTNQYDQLFEFLTQVFGPAPVGPSPEPEPKVSTPLPPAAPPAAPPPTPAGPPINQPMDIPTTTESNPNAWGMSPAQVARYRASSPYDQIGAHPSQPGGLDWDPVRDLLAGHSLAQFNVWNPGSLSKIASAVRGKPAAVAQLPKELQFLAQAPTHNYTGHWTGGRASLLDRPEFVQQRAANDWYSQAATLRSRPAASAYQFPGGV